MVSGRFANAPPMLGNSEGVTVCGLIPPVSTAVMLEVAVAVRVPVLVLLPDTVWLPDTDAVAEGCTPIVVRSWRLVGLALAVPDDGLLV
jgi:hypothetical protein